MQIRNQFEETLLLLRQSTKVVSVESEPIIYEWCVLHEAVRSHSNLLIDRNCRCDRNLSGVQGHKMKAFAKTTATKKIDETAGPSEVRQDEDEDSEEIIIVDDVELDQPPTRRGSAERYESKDSDEIETLPTVAFPNSERHRGRVSSICCQCCCYFIFLFAYLVSIFFSDETVEAYYFQDHLRSVFSVPKATSMKYRDSSTGHDIYIESRAEVNTYVRGKIGKLCSAHAKIPLSVQVRTYNKPTSLTGSELAGQKLFGYPEDTWNVSTELCNNPSSFAFTTRAVALDWNMYNNDTKMFATINLKFEELPSDKVVLYDSILCGRLFLLDTPENVLVLLEYVLIVLAIFYLCLVTIEWCSQGTQAYLSNIWHVFPFLNCMLFLAGLGLKFVARRGLGLGDTPDLEELYFTEMWWFHMSKNVYGLNGLLLFCSAFRFMRGSRKVRVFLVGLGHAAHDLILFSSTILVAVLLGFALAFHLSYGASMHHFRDLPSSVFTLVSVYVGRLDMESIREESSYFGTFLLISYVFVVFILISSTFFSIVDAAYDEAIVTADDEDELIDLHEDFVHVWGIALRALCFPCRKVEVCCQQSIGNCCRKLRRGKGRKRSRKVRSSNKRKEPDDGNGEDEQEKREAGPRSSSIFPSLMKLKINRRRKEGNKKEVVKEAPQVSKREARRNSRALAMTMGSAFKRGRRAPSQFPMGGGSSINAEKLIKELKGLLKEHETVRVDLGSDGIIYLSKGQLHMSDSESSSEISVDNGSDIDVDEFASNTLKTEGAAGKRKEIKRIRAGEAKRDGKREKNEHAYDEAFEDYGVNDHHDDHI